MLKITNHIILHPPNTQGCVTGWAEPRFLSSLQILTTYYILGFFPFSHHNIVIMAFILNPDEFFREVDPPWKQTIFHNKDLQLAWRFGFQPMGWSFRF